MKNRPQTPISNRGFDAQFLGTVPYHNCLILDGVIASIDSVRIKYTYAKTVFNFDTKQRSDTLHHLLNSLTDTARWMAGRYDVRVSECGFRIGNYQNTVTYTLPDGHSFAVLAGRYNYDSSVKQVAPEIIFDFNPNKIPENIWMEIAGLLASMAKEISVQRFDLAMDFPISRDQLKLIQRPGSGYQRFVSKEGAVTEYTGERSHHAAVKLYDKGADLGVDLTCTRLEITIDPKRFKTTTDLFPEIHSLSPLELTMDFDALPFPLQAVILHPDLYDRLRATTSRNTWAKYMKLLDEYEANAGRSNSTRHTLSADQHKHIDIYVRERLNEFICAGTILSTIQS